MFNIFSGIFKKTNREKFSRIYDRYFLYAYTIAYKILNNRLQAEELLQDIFERVWKVIDKIEDENNVKALIGVISRNTAINEIQKLKRRNEKILEYENEGIHINAETNIQKNPVDIVVSEENVRLIYEEIKKLNTIYSDVLILKYKFNFTPEEISKSLDLNVKTVYTRIERGTSILKEKLTMKGGLYSEYR